MPLRSTKQAAFAENTTPYVATVRALDGAKANQAIGPVPGPSQYLLVYQIKVQTASRTGLPVGFRVGFGDSALPAGTVEGTAGMLIEGELAPGDRDFGSPGAGDPGQPLLLTCDKPEGEFGKFWVTFYCQLFDN